VEQLKVEAQKLANQAPTFNTSMSWGSFRNISEIPHRPIESVVLKEGQMDRILSFMRRFLDNEAEYVRLGVPYRTGIMLHGNPGSGKSSTASAIAHELGLNIYYISLSGLDGDDSLARALNEVPPYSLAILEDVDVYNAVKTRKDGETGESNGVTLAGMLNVLDGFNSPHGVITVMTTNHIDALDEAIIRPGRVDLMEELNELDDYQLRGICEYFVGHIPENLPHVAPEGGITSAQIVGIIRNHIPTVQNSANDIVNFILSKELSFTK
jgi:chaperone BCS1